MVGSKIFALRARRYLIAGIVLAVAVIAVAVVFCPAVYEQIEYAEQSHGSNDNTESGLSSFELASRRCEYDSWLAPTASCFIATHRQYSGIHFPITVLKAQQKRVQTAMPQRAGSDASLTKSDSQLSNDAVVIIPGGPGQGGQTTAEWVGYWAQWQRDYGIDYDVILYEPRGTFGSSSYWSCSAYDQLAMTLAAQNLSVLEEEAALSSTVDTCLDEYHQILVSLGMEQGLLGLNSETNAADLRAMMALLQAKLGYQRYHLWGTSYGTRVALLAAADARVASLTLDSPYPFDKGDFSDWPLMLENSVHIHERLFGLLMPAEPGYRQALDTAMAYLQKHPQTFTLSRWDGEPDVTLVLNAERLLSVQFDVLYGVDMLAPFYRGLVDIQERPEELSWALENYVTNVFEPSFSAMVYMATECVDNGRESRQAFIEKTAALAFNRVDWLSLHALDVCARPIFQSAQGQPVAAWKEQPYIQRPTLIFSGRNDPVTPVAWAKHLRAALSDARLTVVDGSGHGLLTENTCDWSAIQQFWATGDTSPPIECNVLAPDQ